MHIKNNKEMYLIYAGEIRNDLYFTLHSAELEKGTKRAPKNVEVHLAVYNDKYELIKVT